MRYLRKSNNSQVLANDWQYPKDSKKIREELGYEQIGFCAYSERYMKRTDAVDVEHFDPRLKNTENDNYWNWYAVLSWMNKHKPRNIEPFEPILQPYSEEVRRRVHYQHGQFLVVNPDDQEALNLITYLGWNKPELAEDRRKHVKRIREVQQKLGGTQDEFFDFLLRDPDNLSFFSALNVELDIPEMLLERLEKAKNNPNRKLGFS